MAAGEHAQNVPKRGAVERRDDADAARQHRQRPFARRVEQAFGLEPPLELLERRLQRAESVRLERVADELILALDLVHG